MRCALSSASSSSKGRRERSGPYRSRGSRRRPSSLRPCCATLPWALRLDRLSPTIALFQLVATCCHFLQLVATCWAIAITARKLSAATRVMSRQPTMEPPTQPTAPEVSNRAARKGPHKSCVRYLGIPVVRALSGAANAASKPRSLEPPRREDEEALEALPKATWTWHCTAKLSS